MKTPLNILEYQPLCKSRGDVEAQCGIGEADCVMAASIV